MKTSQLASAAVCLSLAIGMSPSWAQGGGSGAPSNNPPGTPTNGAGNMQPGGKPAGPAAADTTPMKPDAMKGATGKGDKAMRASKAASGAASSSSMPK